MVDLPHDTNEQWCCGVGMKELWDGVIGKDVQVFHTKPVGYPQSFTFDMGAKVRIDRFKTWSRPDPPSAYMHDAVYSSTDWRVMIVYGTNHLDGTGEFDDTWIKLGKFVAHKPSGLGPGNKYTQTDYQYAVFEGRDMRIKNPLQKPAVRYIRIKVIDTWTSHFGNGFNMAEITFWGQIKKEF